SKPSRNESRCLTHFPTPVPSFRSYAFGFQIKISSLCRSHFRIINLVGLKNMTIEDALSLHNAFRPGGKLHAAHAFSCKEPPADDLLDLDRVYLVSPSDDWIAKISESKKLRSLAIKTPRASDLGPLGKLSLVQFEVSYPTRIKDWGF